MEGSPNGSHLSSQQVPMVGWDMESPQTSKISPRSVILPRPPADSSASPAGTYFIEEWGTNQRNKRRIKRPPKPNLYKRYTFSSPLDTPEKSESSDFDDISDEVISQIRLTPLLAKTGASKSSPTTPVTDKGFPPVICQTKDSRKPSEPSKPLPRKLTFDTVKPSPVSPQTSKQSLEALRKPEPNPRLRDNDDDMFSSDDEEVIRQAELFVNSQSAKSSQPIKGPDRNNSQSAKSSQPNKGPDRNNSQSAKSSQPNKGPDRNNSQSAKSSQPNKGPDRNNSQSAKSSQPNKGPDRNNSQSAKSSQPNKGPDRNNSQSAKSSQPNKEHAKQGPEQENDPFSDSDEFDDIMIDDETLQSIVNRYSVASNKGSRTPPKGPTPPKGTPPKGTPPNKKKQIKRLSLSLKKNKG